MLCTATHWSMKVGAKGAKVASAFYLAELVFTKSNPGNPIQNVGPWERTCLWLIL
jgi:hypothetical protein